MALLSKSFGGQAAVHLPGAGTPMRDALRRWRVRWFPYSIIHSEEPYRLYILAVAHYRRRPKYWKERVQVKSAYYAAQQFAE
jgi:hypothetical protein